MLPKSLFWLSSLATIVLADSNSNSNKTSPNFGPSEVDLVFPRNDTYAPTSLLPIVFAVQKPTHFENDISLDMSVNFRISRLGDDPRLALDPDKNYYDHIDLNPGDEAIDFRSQGFLGASTEGTWVFSYEIIWFNCTPLYRVEKNGLLGTTSVYQNNVTFTTKNGSKPVDLVAAFNKDTCKHSQSATTQINFTQPIPKEYAYDLEPGVHDCAVMKEELPPAQPCNVVLTSERAEAIMKRLNDSICDPNDLANPDHGTTRCYEENQSKKNGGAYLRPLSMSLGIVSVGWLMWLF